MLLDIIGIRYELGVHRHRLAIRWLAGPLFWGACDFPKGNDAARYAGFRGEKFGLEAMLFT